MASKALPAHNGPPPKTGTPLESPSASLYITNLPDKLYKPDLRLSLYTLFSTYGPVLDVVAMKTKKMRGQAHVVFRDVSTSTQAMRALQGFDFFGKELKIQYAKGRSNVFQKLEGVYRPQAAAAEATAPDARQSLFSAPAATTATETIALPAKPADPTINGTKTSDEGPQGVKRRREEESDEEEAPMEEESDVSMEASSDEE
ncbi:MAG: hypothetical protein LQ340_001439 [Diploschistes diacapsis]|nr:MAG: hypothetical protein LQ340_001439 [Diploschistes diacapsis]